MTDDDPPCEFCNLPRATRACRCDPVYIRGSCTEVQCILCRTPQAQRKRGARLYHSGISLPLVPAVDQ